MTLAELKAIKERAEAASPAPWRDNLGCRIIDGDESVVMVYADGYHLDPRPQPTERDIRFICAARSDVPALVAEVERLRGLVKKAQARICSDVCSSEHCDLCLELRDGVAQ